jgi:hypothetical protein
MTAALRLACVFANIGPFFELLKVEKVETRDVVAHGEQGPFPGFMK